jgi:hypothetical protein
VVWKGRVVDGRHRLKICRELGNLLKIEDITESCPTEEMMRARVASLNQHRRSRTTPVSNAEKHARVEAAKSRTGRTGEGATRTTGRRARKLPQHAPAPAPEPPIPPQEPQTPEVDAQQSRDASREANGNATPEASADRAAEGPSGDEELSQAERIRARADFRTAIELLIDVSGRNIDDEIILGEYLPAKEDFVRVLTLIHGLFHSKLLQDRWPKPARRRKSAPAADLPAIPPFLRRGPPADAATAGSEPAAAGESTSQTKH